MSTLELRYFASLREAVGVAAEQLSIPADGIEFVDLLPELRSRHGAEAAAALTRPSVRLALNQELVEIPGLRLQPGDELAFLPPVTGG